MLIQVPVYHTSHEKMSFQSAPQTENGLLYFQIYCIEHGDWVPAHHTSQETVFFSCLFVIYISNIHTEGEKKGQRKFLELNTCKNPLIPSDPIYHLSNWSGPFTFLVYLAWLYFFIYMYSYCYFVLEISLFNGKIANPVATRVFTFCSSSYQGTLRHQWV